MATGNYRALFATSGDRLFSVVGSGFYEIYSDKSWTLHGHLTSVNGNVCISENESQLLIVDGTNGWIFNLLTNLLVRIFNFNDMVHEYILISVRLVIYFKFNGHEEADECPRL